MTIPVYDKKKYDYFCWQAKDMTFPVDKSDMTIPVNMILFHTKDKNMTVIWE